MLGDVMKLGEGIEESKRQVYGAGLLEETSDPMNDISETEKNRYLTKSDVVLGKDQRETVYVEKYEKDVIIRPLTDGELTQVFEMIGKVPLNDMGIPDLNLVDISTNLKALRLITALGLVEPKLSRDDVANMKFGVPGLLAKRILELSGLSERAGDGAKKFR